MQSFILEEHKTYFRFDTSNNMLGHENILKLCSLSFE